MPNKYAIRITEDNLARIRALSPTVGIEVKENQDRYFLFTVDSRNTATEHDVVEGGPDLEIYDSEEGTRIIVE